MHIYVRTYIDLRQSEMHIIYATSATGKKACMRTNIPMYDTF